MRRLILLTTIALLSIPAVAQAAVVPVQTLPSAAVGIDNSIDCATPGGNFTSLTQHAVHFGNFTDALNVGGVDFLQSPANGQALSALTALNYDARAIPSTTAGWSFLQILLDTNADGTTDSVITFSPNTQPNGSQVTGSGTFRNWDVVAGTARFDDAAGNGPDQPFADIQADHPDAVILGISIFAGPCAGSALDVETDMSSAQIGVGNNVVEYVFGLAVAGPVGPAGPQGPVGPRGPQGIAGTPGITNNPPATQNCKGNTRRIIHAPSHANATFVRARATLRGQRLRVRGREITVDLRNQGAGENNVRIRTTYRSKTSGRRYTRVSTRVLRVTCGS